MSEIKIVLTDGTPVRIVYDDETDILEIFFGENMPATGIELTEHILLRIDQSTQKAVSLTLVDFSVLTEQTEYGPRSYSLTGLEELPQDLEDTAVSILMSPPVNHYLKLSSFQVSPQERIITAFVMPQPMPMPA